MPTATQILRGDRSWSPLLLCRFPFYFRLQFTLSRYPRLSSFLSFSLYSGMEKIGFCSSFHNPLPPSFSRKRTGEKKCEKAHHFSHISSNKEKEEKEEKEIKKNSLLQFLIFFLIKGKWERGKREKASVWDACYLKIFSNSINAHLPWTSLFLFPE